MASGGRCGFRRAGLGSARVAIASLVAGPLLAAAVAIGDARPAAAMACETGDFNAWVNDFAKEAAGLGVGPSALNALKGATYDKKVIGLDRNQKVFKQSFEQFVKNRVGGARLKGGRAMLKRHANLLDRIEKTYGVPGAIVVAIWGLETDYGANQGSMPVIRSLATLAYDCRRTEMFQQQLLDALRVLDRGDIALADMRGAWAGEMGQTQFMASSYYKYAVDFDGDGRRDLRRSIPDVLASTANYLNAYGWQRGAGYEPGEPNFNALLGWNKSQVYSRTIAYFADKIQGVD
jgi:lytic murein transglycosylase